MVSHIIKICMHAHIIPKDYFFDHMHSLSLPLASLPPSGLSPPLSLSLSCTAFFEWSWNSNWLMKLNNNSECINLNTLYSGTMQVLVVKDNINEKM